MKRIYGLLLLTAFLTPHTSHSLNRTQLTELKMGLSTALTAATRATDFRDTCTNYAALENAGYEITPAMIRAFKTKFGDTPDVVCARGYVYRAPVAPVVSAAPLNARIAKNNTAITTRFGRVGSMFNIFHQDVYARNMYSEQAKTFNDNALDIVTEASAAGIASAALTPIVILTSTDPATLTAGMAGLTTTANIVAFITAQNATTAIAIGNPGSYGNPVLYVLKVEKPAAPVVPVRPVRPLVALTKEQTAIQKLIIEHNDLVRTTLTPKIAGGTTVKTTLGDVNIVSYLNAIALALMEEAVKCDVQEPVLIATTETPTGALTDSTAFIKTQMDATNKKLASGMGRLMNTYHDVELISVVVMVPAGAVAVAATNDFVYNIAMAHNRWIGNTPTDKTVKLFGNPATPATPITPKQGDNRLIKCLNSYASSLEAVLTSLTIDKGIYIVTVNTPGTPKAQLVRDMDLVAFINSQMTETDAAFAPGRIYGHATPPVYVMRIVNPPVAAPAGGAPAGGAPAGGATTLDAAQIAAVQLTISNLIDGHNALVEYLFSAGRANKTVRGDLDIINQINLVAHSLTQSANFANVTTKTIAIVTINNLSDIQIDGITDSVNFIHKEFTETSTKLESGISRIASSLNTYYDVYVKMIPCKTPTAVANDDTAAMIITSYTTDQNDFITRQIGAITAKGYSALPHQKRLIEYTDKASSYIAGEIDRLSTNDGIFIVTSNKDAAKSRNASDNAFDFINNQMTSTLDAFNTTAPTTVYVMQVSKNTAKPTVNSLTTWVPYPFDFYISVPTAGVKDNAPEILGKMIANYNKYIQQVAQRMADGNGNLKPKPEDRNLLYALGMFAHILNSQAERFTIPNLEIHFLSRQPNIAGTTGAEILETNYGQYTGGIKNDTIYMLSVKTATAGASPLSAKDLLKNCITSYNGIVNIVFKPTGDPLSFAVDADISKTLVALNDLANQVLVSPQSLLSAPLNAPIRIATTSIPTNATLNTINSVEQMKGFISDQNSIITSAFARANRLLNTFGSWPKVYFAEREVRLTPRAPRAETPTTNPLVKLLSYPFETLEFADPEQDDALEILNKTVENYNTYIKDLALTMGTETRNLKAQSTDSDLLYALARFAHYLAVQASLFTVDTNIHFLSRKTDINMPSAVLSLEDNFNAFENKLSNNTPIYVLSVTIHSSNNAGTTAPELMNALRNRYNIIVQDLRTKRANVPDVIPAPGKPLSISGARDMEKVLIALNTFAQKVLIAPQRWITDALDKVIIATTNPLTQAAITRLATINDINEFINTQNRNMKTEFEKSTKSWNYLASWPLVYFVKI